MYTKEGNIPGYSSLFALTPDYNTGFVVLCSGPDNVNDVERVGDVVAATLFPALENTAKAQSMAKLGGTYAAGNGSNLTLTTQPNGPGLVLESWYNNDVDMFELLSQSFLGIDVSIDSRRLILSATHRRHCTIVSQIADNPRSAYTRAISSNTTETQQKRSASELYSKTQLRPYPTAAFSPQTARLGSPTFIYTASKLLTSSSSNWMGRLAKLLASTRLRCSILLSKGCCEGGLGKISISILQPRSSHSITLFG